jgi:hypothetical protein
VDDPSSRPADLEAFLSRDESIWKEKVRDATFYP